MEDLLKVSMAKKQSKKGKLFQRIIWIFLRIFVMHFLAGWIFYQQVWILQKMFFEDKIDNFCSHQNNKKSFLTHYPLATRKGKFIQSVAIKFSEDNLKDKIDDYFIPIRENQVSQGHTY